MRGGDGPVVLTVLMCASDDVHLPVIEVGVLVWEALPVGTFYLRYHNKSMSEL